MPRMSASNVLNKLTSERLCAALLAGAFIKHPHNALRKDRKLWEIVLPYFNRKTAMPTMSLLEALSSTFGPEQLRFYGEYIVMHLSSVSTLQQELENIAKFVVEGVTIKQKSLLGSICIDSWHWFAILDISVANQVWQQLKGETDPFIAKLGISRQDSEIEGLRSILGKALIPPQPRNTPTTTPASPLDISQVQETIHRDSDLNKTTESGLIVLAETYAAQGNIRAAVEAVNEAFIRDRRSLIREMGNKESSGDGQHTVDRKLDLSARNNLELVGWLQNLLCVYELPRSPAPPAALDVPLSQLLSYYTRSASKDSEKVEAFIQELQFAVAMGDLPPENLKSLRNARKMFHSLFKTSQSSLVSPFYMVSARLWHAFGFMAICTSYRQLLEKKLAGEQRPALSSELALLCAFDLELPIEGLAIISSIRGSGWNDTVQATYSLLMAQSLIMSHNFDAAKVTMEQLDDFNLTRRQRDAFTTVKIMLQLYERRFYAGFLTAQNQANHYAGRGATYLELVYTVWAVRCLILSQNEVYAAQARIYIQDALTRAVETKKLGIAVELAVLQARSFYNEHELQTCYDICYRLEPYVDVSATPRLKCEWKMLYTATAHSLNASFKRDKSRYFVHQMELARCLYTEFNPELRDTVVGLHGLQILSLDQRSRNILSRCIQDNFSGILCEQTETSPVYRAYAAEASPGSSSPQQRAATSADSETTSGDDSSLSKLNIHKRTWSVNGSPQRRSLKRRVVPLDSHMDI